MVYRQILVIFKNQVGERFFIAFIKLLQDLYLFLLRLLQVATNPKSCNAGVITHQVHKEYIS